MSESQLIITTTSEEMAYLSKRDKRLAGLIARVGPLSRRGTPDLFAAIVRHIVGQQISTAAQRTIWARLQQLLGEVTPEAVLAISEQELQTVGITFRKAGYIHAFAERVASGAFRPEELRTLSDAETVAALTALPGIGVWTAEMLLIFSLGRKDVLSFNDLGIQRGLKRLYHHKEITRERYLRYRRRYSPCNTAASLYLWEAARNDGGADPAPRERSKL